MGRMKMKRFTVEGWFDQNIRYLPDCMNEPRIHSSDSRERNRTHTIDRRAESIL
jgi:hypothetical protein